MNRIVTVCTVMLLLAAQASAQQDRNAERAARRQQQQLQSLQQQAQQAQADKTKAEAEKSALTEQLKGREQAAARSQAAARALEDKLKAAAAARESLAGRVAELEKMLAEQRRTGELALAERDTQIAQSTLRLRAQAEAQTQLQVRFDEQHRQAAECSAKNERLFQLNAALIDRYRGKGVVDVLQQREPLFGFGDVQMFNRVQDERDKAEAERFVPVAAPR